MVIDRDAQRRRRHERIRHAGQKSSHRCQCNTPCGSVCRHDCRQLAQRAAEYTQTKSFPHTHTEQEHELARKSKIVHFLQRGSSTDFPCGIRPATPRERGCAFAKSATANSTSPILPLPFLPTSATPNMSLPIVFFDIAIGGQHAGRIEMTVRVVPLACLFWEFRLLFLPEHGSYAARGFTSRYMQVRPDQTTNPRAPDRQGATWQALGLARRRTGWHAS